MACIKSLKKNKKKYEKKREKKEWNMIKPFNITLHLYTMKKKRLKISFPSWLVTDKVSFNIHWQLVFHLNQLTYFISCK